MYLHGTKRTTQHTPRLPHTITHKLTIVLPPAPPPPLKIKQTVAIPSVGTPPI